MSAPEHAHRSGLRVFIDSQQVALRVGPHFFGLRGGSLRELWSERNRIGWRVRYLPLGWRAFYVRRSQKERLHG